MVTQTGRLMFLLLKLVSPKVPNQRAFFTPPPPWPKIVIIVLFTLEFVEGFVISQSSFMLD